jgi:hypothetical protein
MPCGVLSIHIQANPASLATSSISHSSRDLPMPGLAAKQDGPAAARFHGTSQESRPCASFSSLRPMSGAASRQGGLNTTLSPKPMDLDRRLWPRSTPLAQMIYADPRFRGRDRGFVEQDLVGLGQLLESRARSSSGRRSGPRTCSRHFPKSRHDLAGGDADAQLHGPVESPVAYVASAACISRAHRQARRGSSSWAAGTPKTASTASPMNFSSVPPKCTTAFAITVSAPSTRARTSSGSSSSTSVV